ncbi:MAG: DNA mismatch repair protein MutS [candidate division Zixibacteria bacterium]|nr:DNA mismatch repair protein MutS [candidate division Zixibacteria bacterium]
MTGSAGKDSRITPLMRQFHDIKAQHPDKILFFRMGDFYEMFGDDAVRAAPILGITLTSRAHGAQERIPLAGVPHHSADKYLARLVSAGEKVVIVEQTEDPKTAKGLVKRGIVEILTPGTAAIDTGESDQQSVWLVALYERLKPKTLGLAALDLSTGSFIVDEGSSDEMLERLKVLGPKEILYPSSCSDNPDLVTRLGLTNGETQLTGFEDWNFDYRTAKRELNDQFGTSTLDGFGVGDSHAAITAAGAVLRYLKENHLENLRHINRLTRFDQDEYMALDYGTVRNLELVANIALNTEQHTLFSAVNRCQTGAGGRRLRNALLRPFRSRARIERRLSGVAELVRNRELAYAIRQQTTGSPDLEKLAGRLGIGKLNPRQALGIRDGLSVCRQLRQILAEANGPHLSGIGGSLPDCDDIIARVSEALTDEPPLVTTKGDIIQRGFSTELDKLNDSIRDARQYIASLAKTERERTGINTLKVGFNKVFGYYIEVTKINSDGVPEDYIRKQTLVNAERYITPELKEKEALILTAEEKIFKLEEELYCQLVESLAVRIADIIASGDLVAEIDLVSGLAEVAVENHYCRPEIFEDSRLDIEEGRHAVIETVLPTGSFVANDITLSSEKDRIQILTGPNMSGKSTYLRQTGLIVILAQIGSFVPAARAEIGLADRVFTRVGAVDNLARGQSTFLVEMVETANILHNATDRSVVLLDEVGRGTSTFDGLSVAWAVVEYINEHSKSRTVFATHYHELTGMAEIYPQIVNFQVAVKKWEDRVVFLHKIVPGGCDDSYGIEVAKLAGLPRQPIVRARQILRLLESGKFTRSELGQGIYKEKVQPSLFEPQPSKTEEKIRTADIDHMTPVEAFDFLRQLREDME